MTAVGCRAIVCGGDRLAGGLQALGEEVRSADLLRGNGRRDQRQEERRDRDEAAKPAL